MTSPELSFFLLYCHISILMIFCFDYYIYHLEEHLDSMKLLVTEHTSVYFCWEVFFVVFWGQNSWQRSDVCWILHHHHHRVTIWILSKMKTPRSSKMWILLHCRVYNSSYNILPFHFMMFFFLFLLLFKNKLANISYLLTALYKHKARAHANVARH